MPCIKVCLLFLCTLLAPASGVMITNHKDEETILYEVALIKGALTNGSSAKLLCWNNQTVITIRVLNSRGRVSAWRTGVDPLQG